MYLRLAKIAFDGISADGAVKIKGQRPFPPSSRKTANGRQGGGGGGFEQWPFSVDEVGFSF